MSKKANATPAEEIAPISRGTLDVNPGNLVRHGDAIYRVKDIVGMTKIVGENLDTGRVDILPIESLSVADEPVSECDLQEIPTEVWKEARRRHEAIKPLMRPDGVTRTEVEARAAECGVSGSTLYRWLNAYARTQSLMALCPLKRGWTYGRIRIASPAEAVIQEVIDDYYLTTQRPSAQKAIEEVFRRCHAQGIPAPSARTVRYRIDAIPPARNYRGRLGRRKGRNPYQPAPGTFPGADFPLAVIQIDHTPADIVLVDDRDRQPIGRPWITVAVDIFSRAITGFSLSLDPPSVVSVGLCLVHAMLPKDKWLLDHGIDADWPVFGIPRTIHVDNGADFRSQPFQMACEAHGINLEYRPVRQPWYGGGIERLIGTLMRETHALPGTTFSNIKAKEGYDPEKHAAMTLGEYETWLARLICTVYHHRKHSGIGMAPQRKWELGIHGDADTPGRGVPPIPRDRETLLLDFLPGEWRTVQADGVSYDSLRYYDEALRPWIGAKDPQDPGRKRKFLFRRDPRDISAIWFKPPDSSSYRRIPAAVLDMPRLSVWEYQAARNSLQKRGLHSPTNLQILRAQGELRDMADRSAQTTKKARRDAQRRRQHEKATAPKNLKQPSGASPSQSKSDPYFDFDLDDIRPFDDIS